MTASSVTSGALRTLPDEFGLSLRFQSDWHVGAGFGRPGSVDSLVVRDHDDLPFVPAKTITGIWRDAAELVARSLDGGADHGPWQAWVVYLFGIQPDASRDAPTAPPRAAALSLRPLRLSPAVRRHLAGDAPDRRAFRQELTFVKPGVRIDRRTGRAKPDYLRFEEMARAGLSLLGGAHLPDQLDASQREHCTALLVASAGFVTRLGGKRRRGAGRMELSIPGAPEPGAVADWLEGRAGEVTEPPASEDVAGQESPFVVEQTAAQAGWKVVPLRIELQTPTIVPSRTVGNVVETLDRVPGTYLLPHVARSLSALGIDAWPAIARGNIVVLDATLEVDGARGLPAPLALRHVKSVTARESFEVQGGVRNALRDDPDPGWKGCRSGYVAPDGADTLPGFATVPRTERTHSTVEDQRQRPTSDIGGVYTYEAIEGGTVLRSELWVRDPVEAALRGSRPEWFRDLDGAIRLGRSKKDDYGQARVSALSPPTRPADSPSDIGQPTMVVWCLSDVLLVDEWLRPDPTPGRLAQELGKELGAQLRVCASHVRVHRLESWQSGWGLPRPSLVALSAGSCVELEVTNPDANLGAESWAEIQHSGLGLRRGEGFGRIRVNAPLLCRGLAEMGPGAGNPRESDSPDARSIDDKDDREVAEQLETLLWRRRIREQALIRMSEREKREEWLGFDSSARKPPASQVAALRGFMRGFDQTRKEHLVAWLDHLAETENRISKWPVRAAKVRELIEGEEVVWDLLGAGRWPVLTGGAGSSRLRTELWPDAVGAVIAAAARGHKRDMEETVGKGARDGQDAHR